MALPLAARLSVARLAAEAGALVGDWIAEGDLGHVGLELDTLAIIAGPVARDEAFKPDRDLVLVVADQISEWTTAVLHVDQRERDLADLWCFRLRLRRHASRPL